MLDEEEEAAVGSVVLQTADSPVPDSPLSPDIHELSLSEHIAAVPDVCEPGEDLECEDEPALFTDTSTVCTYMYMHT